MMNDTDRESIFSSIPTTLKWPDYCVVVVTLVASIGIGVYYGFFDKKNKTNEEYLMAGRTMSLFPVAMSLLGSLISSVMLLGLPVETYYYGLNVWSWVCHVFLALAVSYLYLPVYWKLQMTSAYEYLEVRFNAKVRRSVSACAVVHMILVMPLSVWAPTLAFDQVIGINKYISCATIFIVCILYSSIGGLKAVLWSDTLQELILFASLGAVLGIGIVDGGGISEVWQKAKDMDRLHLVIWDTDPRTRQTMWTAIIGSPFSWLPFVAASQAHVQRYLSVPTISMARASIWINLIGLNVVGLLCLFAGVIVLAKYKDCDPVTFKEDMAADQLVPLFVMDVMRDYVGMPGLFVAGLLCGSLSSISTALNAIPAVIVTDFVKPLRPGFSDRQLRNISRLLSLLGGTISFGIVFVMSSVGNLIPFAVVIHGTFLGPIVGIFTLGIFFPWCNALGSIMGMIPSLTITLFLGIGSIVAGDNLPNQKLPLRQDGCYLANSTMVPPFHEGDGMPNAWKDQEYSPLSNFLAVSYLWVPMITFVTTVFFGLVFSLIINLFQEPKSVKSKYLAPPLLTLWTRIFGEKRLSNWVEYENDSNELQ